MTNGSATPAAAVPLLARRIAAREILLRRGGMFGKDLIRGTRVAAGLAFAMYAAWLCGFGAAMMGSGTNPVAPVFLFQLFLPVLAYILGLALTGEEEELDTRFFADRLPAPRLGQLAAKIAAGVVLWFAAVAACALLWEIATGPPFGDFLRKFAASYEGSLLADPRGAMWFATLFLGGLATGAVFRRNMILAGVVGYAAIMAVQLACAVAFGLLAASRGSIASLGLVLDVRITSSRAIGVPVHEHPFLAMAITCVLALALASWRFATRSEVEEGRWVRWTAALAKAMPARRPSLDAVAMVHRDVRRWGWRVAIAVPAFASAAHAVWLPDTAFLMALAAFFVALVAYGLLSNPAPEGDIGTFFLHALPVEHHRIVAARTWRLAAASLATGVLTFAALFIAWSLNPQEAPPDFFDDMRAETLLPQLLLPLAFGGVATALLGHLARFYFRQAIVAFVAAGCVAAVWWMVAFVVIAVNVALLPWTLAVAIASAWIAIRVTVRHSLVLELNAGPRGAAWLLCGLILVVWGMFLMTMSPMDVVRMVIP